MENFAGLVKGVGELLFSGAGVYSESQYLIELRAPYYPLCVDFFHCDYGRRAEKIEVSASLPRGIGGTYSQRSLYAYEDGASSYGAGSPRRTFTASRFETTPAKVAAEIQRYVVEPAEPLVLKAVKAIADRAALEYENETFARDLARDNDLRLSDQGGDSFYIYDLPDRFEHGSNGRIRIDKNGYIEFSIRYLSREKLRSLVQWMTSQSRQPNSKP